MELPIEFMYESWENFLIGRKAFEGAINLKSVKYKTNILK